MVLLLTTNITKCEDLRDQLVLHSLNFVHVLRIFKRILKIKELCFLRMLSNVVTSNGNILTSE